MSFIRKLTFNFTNKEHQTFLCNICKKMISLCSLCVAVNCPVSFLTSYTYPYLMQGVGGQGTFWLYSAVGWSVEIIFDWTEQVN